MNVDIVINLTGFASMFKYDVTRWDAVNYCVGYYGSVTNEHIEAIQHLVNLYVIKE